MVNSKKALEDLSLLWGSEQHDHASTSCPTMLFVCFFAVVVLGVCLDLFTEPKLK